MNEVTELWTREVYCRCPNCGEILSAYVGDPRGGDDQCEYCGALFVIHEDADVDVDLY